MSGRIEKLEAMLKADPTDAFVLYGLAQEHGKLGTPDAHRKAVGFYDRCLTADPNYFYAYFHKAMSQIGLEETEQAAETLRKGLAAARAGGDQKATGEIAGLLDQIT
jgi:tetratricopeptide (TPR) repeat protein